MLPLRTALSRAASRRSAPSTFSRTILRHYSQQQQRQPPSPTGAFYKTFTRPVAKCALLAVLVYQLAYFGWRKLEADEIGEERRAEIARLETQVRALQAAKAAEEAAAADAAAAVKGGVDGGGSGGGEEKGSSWWSWR